METYLEGETQTDPKGPEVRRVTPQGEDPLTKGPPGSGLSPPEPDMVASLLLKDPTGDARAQAITRSLAANPPIVDDQKGHLPHQMTSEVDLHDQTHGSRPTGEVRTSSKKLEKRVVPTFSVLSPDRAVMEISSLHKLLMLNNIR